MVGFFFSTVFQHVHFKTFKLEDKFRKKNKPNQKTTNKNTKKPNQTKHPLNYIFRQVILCVCVCRGWEWLRYTIGLYFK